MRCPDPIWETDYAADRRKHRYRCVYGNRIVQPGERVVMCCINKGPRPPMPIASTSQKPLRRRVTSCVCGGWGTKKRAAGPCPIPPDN